jgi:cell division protein ZapE
VGGQASRVRPAVAVDGNVVRRRAPLIAHLEPLLAARGTTLDHAQTTALDRLESLAVELEAFRAARQSTLKKLFSPPDVPRGVYLWGGVGRGKSLLMDAFFATVGIRRKTRVHFHAFMRDVHEALAALKNEPDPLAAVAARIAKRWRLVCFDEFHVSDIADAMILGRLFSALFTHGVVFVLTSNYSPDGLWPNGLQRERFLPAIALLQEWLDVVEVDAGVDYRLRALEQAGSYHTPLGPQADAALDAAFERMRSGPDENPHLAIEGRTLHALKCAGSAVWFDFATLCDGPRSQRDYLELARTFPVLILSGVPRMSAEMGDRARRFTWLVDILYDHRVKLLVSAQAPPDELYREGPNSREFPRTVSRLVEMQTREYMAQPHLAAEATATATA